SQLKARIIAPAVERTAAGETRGGATQRAGSWKNAPAIWTEIEVPASLPSDREGEIVAARFIGNPQICAGTVPIMAMRRDPATACARLRQQVSEFMAQRAVDLRFTVFAKPAVEKDASTGEFRATGGGTQTARPFNTHLGGDLG